MDDTRVDPGWKGDHLDLRERLLAFLKEQDLAIPASDLKEDTLLISSGLLDSLALYNLTLWVEREAGRSYDLTTVDLSREWDTVTGIAGFVEMLVRADGAHSNAETAQQG